ncbi:MAG: hypothetical protein AB7P53_02985 [Candidatus Dadabacteria bacterium]
MNVLIETVSEDLLHLKKDWIDSVEDDVLRRSSIVLRRLLVEKDLPRALRAAALPSQAIITSSTLSQSLQMIPLKNVVFASAGGAKCSGFEIRGQFMVNYALNEKEIAKLNSRDVPNASMKLHDFVEAPCIVLSGVLISRRILIQYIANKLGGAHLDPKRAKGEREFILLDRAYSDLKLKLAGKPLIYYELLSIGQALVSSKDIEAFLEKVRK